MDEATIDRYGGTAREDEYTVAVSLANAKLDERCFRRCKELNNKEKSWPEWKQQLSSAVRECDASFADYLWATEQSDKVIDLMDLDPTQTQLSAVLYSRLTSLTTGEAFAILQLHEGNGIEGLRQLVKRFDPKTDARLTMLILGLFTYKIKQKDILAGLANWESRIITLTRDYKDCQSAPKMERALLMHVLPEKM